MWKARIGTEKVQFLRDIVAVGTRLFARRHPSNRGSEQLGQILETQRGNCGVCVSAPFTAGV